jgi:hypothetical protein
MAIEERLRHSSVPAGRLWFGLIASVFAWISLGIIDILITWRACIHPEQYGAGSSQPGARAIYIATAALLFLVVIASGTTSYRNWRLISTQRRLLNATANDRQEFMALLGIFISITLGVGILWLAVPSLFLEVCARVR